MRRIENTSLACGRWVYLLITLFGILSHANYIPQHCISFLKLFVPSALRWINEDFHLNTGDFCFLFQIKKNSLSMAYSWHQRFPRSEGSLKSSTPEIWYPKIKGVSPLITTFPHSQEHIKSVKNFPNQHLTILFVHCALTPVGSL